MDIDAYIRVIEHKRGNLSCTAVLVRPVRCLVESFFCVHAIKIALFTGGAFVHLDRVQVSKNEIKRPCCECARLAKKILREPLYNLDASTFVSMRPAKDGDRRPRGRGGDFPNRRSDFLYRHSVFRLKKIQ